MWQGKPEWQIPHIFSLYKLVLSMVCSLVRTVAIPTVGWNIFYSYWTFMTRRVRLRYNSIDPED